MGEEENNQENVLDPTGMIEALTQPSEQAFSMPEEISGIKADEWVKGFEQISDGKLKGIDDFRSLMDKASRFDELAPKYKELETKANVNPYANDYVKTLNEMYQSGAKDSEIALFKKMQSLDLETMPPQEVLKLKRQMEYPELTKAEVEATFEKEFGDSEDWTDADKALMKQKSIDAMKSLSQLKVDSSKPESLRQKEFAEQQFNQKVDYWQKVEAAVEVPTSFKIDKKLSGDFAYDFDFPLPEGALEQLKKARFQHLVNSDIKPGDAKGYKESMAKFQDAFLFASYGPQILEAALEDMKSKIGLKTNQKHHNVIPSPKGTDHQKPKVSSETAAYLAKQREKGLRG